MVIIGVVLIGMLALLTLRTLPSPLLTVPPTTSRPWSQNLLTAPSSLDLLTLIITMNTIIERPLRNLFLQLLLWWLLPRLG